MGRSDILSAVARGVGNRRLRLIKRLERTALAQMLCAIRGAIGARPKHDVRKTFGAFVVVDAVSRHLLAPLMMELRYITDWQCQSIIVMTGKKYMSV